MNIIDKKNVLPRLKVGEFVSIELGCGPKKVDSSAIGIDMLDFDSVDIVGDVFEVLSQFPDGSVSAVHSAHFFEHIADFSRLLQEVARVMRRDAQLTLIVPHFSNPFYYSDPTHKVQFGLYSMSYFCQQNLFSRKVPRYGVEVPLALVRVELGFKSYPPRYLRHAWKRLLGAVFNASMYLREFYEENLCWLLPCYEIRYELRKQ